MSGVKNVSGMYHSYRREILVPKSNNQKSVWVPEVFSNIFEAIILLKLLVFCFRGNVEKKMLFYPKELHVSIN